MKEQILKEDFINIVSKFPEYVPHSLSKEHIASRFYNYENKEKIAENLNSCLEAIKLEYGSEYSYKLTVEQDKNNILFAGIYKTLKQTLLQQRIALFKEEFLD